MTSPLDPAALELYEAPFRYCDQFGTIEDARGRDVFALFGTQKPELRHHIAAALTEYWERNKS